MRDFLLILAGFCFGFATGGMAAGYSSWLNNRLCEKCKKHKKADKERSENGT